MTWLDQEGAENIAQYDVEFQSDITNHIVVATLLNPLHLRAVGERLVQTLKHQKIVKSGLEVDGLDSMEWIVLDLDTTMIHLFTPEGRSQYDLDQLWGQSEAERMQELELFLKQDTIPDLRTLTLKSTSVEGNEEMEARNATEASSR
jgi:ribosome-associated protein